MMIKNFIIIFAFTLGLSAAGIYYLDTQKKLEIDYPKEAILLSDSQIKKIQNKHKSKPKLHKAAIDTLIALELVKKAGVGEGDLTQAEATNLFKHSAYCLEQSTSVPKVETQYLYKVSLYNEEESNKLMAGLDRGILKDQVLHFDLTCPLDFTKKTG